MLPWASLAILETSPSFHCGGTFGQLGSTAKVGRLRVCAWAGVCAMAVVAVSAVAPNAAAAKAIAAARDLVCIICFLPAARIVAAFAGRRKGASQRTCA